MKTKIFKRTVSLFATLAIMTTMFSLGITASAASGVSISYAFSGLNAASAGYAEGTITLKSSSAGTYSLYWADDTKALDGYYSIATLTLSAGESKTVSMGYHTAIPANATKIIATKTSSKAVSSAEAVYSVPESKQLNSASGELLYTFNSYSDVHIDNNGYYVNANTHFGEALEYGVEKNTDFIVSSGDMVKNASGPDDEWKVYERILSESDYVNPIWETNGNHDMRCGVESGLTSFVRNSGTDSTIANFDSNKPYYYMIEKNTGDLFIFMALEKHSNPSSCDEFSSAQMAWVTNLLETYYNTGINVYLIEHSPIEGFGAGDRMSNPYYKALLSENFASTVQFKNLLKKYQNLIFMSGHTHEDLTMGYNYSNENNTACHMIHNPAVVGTTVPAADDASLNYNNGKGCNSQGYYVETYENNIVFYGANLTDKLIYPQYCYIMEGSRNTPYVNSNTDDEIKLSGVTVSASDKLSEVSDVLAEYYTYSSYDQYQALKKLYYQYKGKTSADKNVIAKFDERIAELKDIADHVGLPKNYKIGDTYYFENSKSWSKVYAYAWTGSNSNAEWPGVLLSPSGTKNGNDVYCVKFNSAGQYKNIIFNNGSSQTVDISLGEYENNAFRIKGTNSTGKYTVENYDIDEVVPVVKSEYALLYYIESVHANWNDTSALLKSNEDGSYEYSYTAVSTNTMSIGIYDKTNSVYKTLSASVGFDYTDGMTYEYTLESKSARGRSITISGLAKGNVVNIKYNPSTEKISVTCGTPKVYDLSDEYYFENTNSWDTLYAYAWSDTGSNAVWPGVKMTKSGTKDGYDIYKIKFDYAGQYENIIFNDGTNQTVDILLSNYPNNAFRLSGTATNSKYNISNYGIVADDVYALIYYIEGLHNWSDIDTFFSLDENGVYHYTYTATTDASVSMSLYNKTKNTYKGLSASSGINFESGKTYEYNIESQSIRLKSITVNGLLKDDVFDITYNPQTEKVSITFGVRSVPLENTSKISSDAIYLGKTVTVNASAAGGTGSYQYAVYYKKTSDNNWTTKQKYSSNSKVSIKPSNAEIYEICVKVKDDAGVEVKKYFSVNVSKVLTNVSTISDSSVVIGKKVKINAAASGGTGSYQYAVYYKKSGGSSWTAKQKYSENSTVSIKLAQAADYEICVKVKDSLGTEVKKYFTVNVLAALSNTSTVSATSVNLGGTVKVDAAAAGGTGSYQYAVYYKKSGDSSWTAKQKYSENSTVSIKPVQATDYEICVKVKDSSGTEVKKYFSVSVN